MKKVYHKTNQIYLRLVDFEDMEDLLKWRNEKGSREASFKTEKISIKEHINWFNKSLLNPKRNIFIIIDKNCNKLGQIRFDRNIDIAEIHITINPKYRNKGVGTLVLCKASKEYLNNFDIKKLIGKVKKNNITSIKAFENAGFEIKKKDEKYIELWYEKVKEKTS